MSEYHRHDDLPPPERGGPIIECRGLTKRFGGTVALDNITVSVEPTTVHALVGENGAGKSTLGKVLAGVHTPDEGEVLVDGEPVELRSPKAALGVGITMVAQELSLVAGRSVVENVFLGIESARCGILSARTDHERFEELVSQTGLEIDARAKVGSLSVAEQQRVEILRALARHARIIVFDEPTARLSHHEAMTLRDIVRDLAASGVTVVYVSHLLDEILALSDRVTVMRNGEIVRTADTARETHDTLVEGIAGRRLDAVFPARQPPSAEMNAVLELNDLARTGEFEDISLAVHPGEIVVLAGLVGSGRTEVARTVFGATQPTRGTMRLGGEPYAPRRQRDAIQLGVAMIPESRRTDGLFMRRRVADNVSLPHLSNFTKFGVVRPRNERLRVTQATEDVRLTGASIDSPMNALSGGNQQKSLFARCLVSPPRLLIADEPTRGVDVGAKRAIYDLLVELASEGMAILAVSSEIDEVLGIAHRIVVMREGRIAAELDGGNTTDAELMRFAFGVTAA